MTKIGMSQGGGVVPLPIYLLGAGDQPTTCPICGARTDWEDVPQEDDVNVQRHECLNCKYEFILEEDTWG